MGGHRISRPLTPSYETGRPVFLDGTDLAIGETAVIEEKTMAIKFATISRNRTKQRRTLLGKRR
jgi:hypothetical protein